MRLVDLIASEYGWTISEILDKLTMNELIVLAIAIEQRTWEKRAIRALECGADKKVIKKELTRIEQDYKFLMNSASETQESCDCAVKHFEDVKGFFNCEVRAK